ncbi:tudor and KH domain-containing protein-like isoform X2 [Pomacea canaliculata]|uniref:tudor and KH domain-containing protein-like isoform X2 n=1 Tax=Pomacea canaliculata TaxID=400727 RepID=UPI000D73800E|nr:tudor and KH domain-containing protein-like isoform X2 [Pomacea canaliculata]
MQQISILGKLAAVFIAIPATICLAYWLFVRRDDDDEYGSKKVEITSRQTVIQVAVPNKAVGSVIGRQGITIKEIHEMSGAKVYFSDHDSNHTSEEDRLVVIRGTSEEALKAELMIRKIVADVSNIITEEVQVPGYCLGRIIGRGGENIRMISRLSQCKIVADKSHRSQRTSAFRVISITGHQQQIKLAKSLIEEKVSEEEESRAKTRVNDGSREQQKQAKAHTNREKEEQLFSLPSRVVEEGEQWDVGIKCSESSSIRDSMEVFVSAVEHPGHFWVQIITASSLQLDKMTDDMTSFYNNSATAQTYGVSEVRPGDVVAAPFEADRAWYRARILGMQEGNVDLYFIDFGDNGLVKPDQLRQLKPEYLSLPVQAIECKLADVEPVGGSWSDEACETFERLCHCSEWKILAAQTVKYELSTSGELLPCLQLFDNSKDQVDIAAELVVQGFAFQSSQAASAQATEMVRTETEADCHLDLKFNSL